MKHLLCTISYENSAKNIFECRTYFIDERHRQQGWDGRSPLNLYLDTVIDAAARHVRQSTTYEVWLHQLRLSVLPIDESTDYHYFNVTFEPVDDDIDEEYEVLLDLDANVIEPQVRSFKNKKEYDRYLDSI